jgi:hypothetical protein
MNMISTGAFQTEMDASNKQPTLAGKFAAVWEKKNAKAARAGGVSLMALSLAACGSDDATTTATTTTTTATTTTTTTVTPITTALTVGVDNVTGTTGNDTITGARIDSVLALTSADTIAGGDGTDSLTATVGATLTPTTAGITGVETITLTPSANSTVDFSSATADFITGATSISSLGAQAFTMDFTNITGLAEMTVNNTSAAHSFEFKDSLLTGTADTLTLNLISAGAAVTVGSQTDADGDYETLIINASGAASDLVGGNGLGADATTITVNASVALDLGSTAAFEKITTFSAAGSTGGVTAVFGNKAAAGTTAVTINGGEGADVLDISALTDANHGAVTMDLGGGNDSLTLAGAGASDFTIDAGDGTDTVSISVVSSAVLHGKLSNFEVLKTTDVIANAATTTLDMSNFVNSNFTTVDFRGTLAAAATNSVSDVFAITNAKDTVTDLKLNALDLSDASVTFARLVDGTANALTLTATATSAAGSFAANDEETITVNTATASIDYTAVSVTDLTSLTLIGDNDADLGTVTATKLATVDASGLEDSDGTDGDFIADMSSSVVAMTVTGNASSTHGGILNITTGGNADTITGTKNADTITAGAGSDTITGGIGADILTGGTGNDTITGGTGADVLNYDAAFGADTITDFVAGASGDVLDFQAWGSVTTAVTLGAVALTNNKITVTTEDASNDTAAEIDALFEALTDATAVQATVTYTNTYIAVDASNVGTIYGVSTADSSGNNGLAATVTEYGTIDLGSTLWTTLTTANFDM